MSGDIWLFRPFNGLFWGVFAAFLILLIVSSMILRRKEERIRRSTIVAASLLTLVGFFAYKYSLSIDGEYDVLSRATGGFSWWGELPLHLCNINMILIPIAVLSNKRPLMSFCFFIGPLGAMMAIVMPGTGFSGYSLLLPRMLGYYLTHFAIVIEALALVTFGLFKPRWRDIPMTMLTLTLITLIIFGVNMLLRATGLHPHANYFYSVETEGNALLDLFYSWLSVPFLYLLLPCNAILLIYMSLVMCVVKVSERLRRH